MILTLGFDPSVHFCRKPNIEYKFDVLYFQWYVFKTQKFGQIFDVSCFDLFNRRWRHRCKKMLKNFGPSLKQNEKKIKTVDSQLSSKSDLRDFRTWSRFATSRRSVPKPRATTSPWSPPVPPDLWLTSIEPLPTVKTGLFDRNRFSKEKKTKRNSLRHLRHRFLFKGEKNKSLHRWCWKVHHWWG